MDSKELATKGKVRPKGAKLVTEGDRFVSLENRCSVHSASLPRGLYFGAKSYCFVHS